MPNKRRSYRIKFMIRAPSDKWSGHNQKGERIDGPVAVENGKLPFGRNEYRPIGG
jgi:hypothetical protein